MILFSVKPLMQTPGWMAKALNRGLKVTSRAEKFGRIEYLIKDDAGVVSLKQAPDNILRGVLDEPTLAQEIIIKQLAKIGLIETGQ